MDTVTSAPHYAVAFGREPGIYMKWVEVKEQTDGFQGALYKTFLSEKEATSWIQLQHEKAARRHEKISSSKIAAGSSETRIGIPRKSGRGRARPARQYAEKRDAVSEVRINQPMQVIPADPNAPRPKSARSRARGPKTYISNPYIIPSEVIPQSIPVPVQGNAGRIQDALAAEKHAIELRNIRLFVSVVRNGDVAMYAYAIYDKNNKANRILRGTTHSADHIAELTAIWKGIKVLDFCYPLQAYDFVKEADGSWEALITTLNLEIIVDCEECVSLLESCDPKAVPIQSVDLTPAQLLVKDIMKFCAIDGWNTSFKYVAAGGSSEDNGSHISLMNCTRDLAEKAPIIPQASPRKTAPKWYGGSATTHQAMFFSPQSNSGGK